uniref:Uncharacterized protein n=1 Tax=Triticum urartu TaxID=4572 RepID=A0A8R7QE91_TRIUA
MKVDASGWTRDIRSESGMGDSVEIEGSEQSENIRVEGLAWDSPRVGYTGKQAYPD